MQAVPPFYRFSTENRASPSRSSPRAKAPPCWPAGWPTSHAPTWRKTVWATARMPSGRMAASTALPLVPLTLQLLTLVAAACIVDRSGGRADVGRQRAVAERRRRDAARFRRLQDETWEANQQIAGIGNAANRLRVIRQVRYSLHNEKCIDLVLFLNGIAVATVREEVARLPRIERVLFCCFSSADLERYQQLLSKDAAL